MSETPCQPSQPESGPPRTDLADIATDRGTSNPEQGTTESRREEVSPFSHPARNAEAQDATSEEPDDEFGPGFPQRLKDIIRGGAVIMTKWNNAETAPDACQSADNDPPAVVTISNATPAENGVSGANLDDADEIPVTMSQIGLPKHLDAVMRACNTADDEAPATGTEALVCRDIAKRQRRGLAKYGKTVIGNNLSFAQWLQHFYEELLDGAVYAKRILTMTHEPENENQSDGVPSSVLPDNAASPNRHRKPGAGRKAKPCPGCGATKSIGSTVKNGIPTRRCKACGFVVQTYPHLANAAKAPAEMA